MFGPPRRQTIISVVLCACICAPAHAQPETADEPKSSDPAEATGRRLTSYLEKLQSKRRVSTETVTLEYLKRTIQKGQHLFLESRYDESVLKLFEVVESPSFADFSDEPEFRGAEFILARSLIKLGAIRSAATYLERVLARGVEDAYFGPAYRAYIDAALSSGRLRVYIERLEQIAGDDLPEDAENELRYLRGRMSYDKRDFKMAEQHLSAITKTSRFYANAQYLRGTISVHQGNLKTAENRFCSVATNGKNERYTFHIDGRFFEVKDLAALALGRVAHEQRRTDDAFYYYFQVPNDSDRVAEALYEAAFTMYEGADHDTAVDLLDQLEVHHPESVYVDEANILRGYVELGRCEFEKASQLFKKFSQRFTPVLREVDAILADRGLQQSLYETLLIEREAQEELNRLGEAAQSPQSLLLAMLQMDPAFYEHHVRIRMLDAEAARAGRLDADVQALRSIILGEERPAPSLPREQAVDRAKKVAGLRSARALLTDLSSQLRLLRRNGVNVRTVRELESERRALGKRIDSLEEALLTSETATDVVDDGTQEGSQVGADLPALLEADAAAAESMPARIQAVRATLVKAANDAAVRSLRVLRKRLAKGLRRAQIGRIDAVMGSKGRIEIQIESLAAGRFPPELYSPLRVQGLIEESQEYWPFDGEVWQDEFEDAIPIEKVKR